MTPVRYSCEFCHTKTTKISRNKITLPATCIQVTVRMAKVRPRPVPFPANESGGQLWTYPAFSAAAQETRDGGGTWDGDESVGAAFVNGSAGGPSTNETGGAWPRDAAWSRFSKCKEYCAATAARALAPGLFTRDGWVARRATGFACGVEGNAKGGFHS